MDSEAVEILLLGSGILPIPPPGYGAVEQILFEYGEALRRAGESVRVANEVRGGHSTDEYRFARHLPAKIRSGHFDIVHASTPVVANRLALARIPYVFTSHSRHWFWRPRLRHRWGFWLERRAVRSARGVVALTPALEEEMRRSLGGRLRSPVRSIPSGVDPDAFQPDWERRVGRLALGVGVVLPFKRWELAARALRGTPLRLALAGPTPDPAYAARVRAAGEGVELLGELSDAQLREMYRVADLLVHPSVVEVLPRAVLQGLAAALPVLGAAPVASVVREGITGFAAPPELSEGEIVSFLHGRAQQLASDAPLRRRMGEAARFEAQSVYSWDHVVARHLEFYRELLSTGADASRPESRSG